MKKTTLLLTFASLITPALATDYHFNVADGDWYNASLWNPNTVPQGGGGNFAYIDAGKTVTINQDTDGGGSGLDIQDTFVGRNGGNTGTVNQTGGIFNHNNGWLFVGDAGGTGTWNMSGSSSIAGDNRILIGRDGGTGTWSMTGSSSVLANRIYVGGHRDSGGGGNGTLNINTTGTITSTSDFNVATQGATGSVVMTAGTLNANSWVIIGETQNGKGGSVGTMVQNGGNVNFGATDGAGRFWLGSQENGSSGASSSGSYTLNSGNLTSRNISIGHGGTGYSGSFTQTGGYYHVLGGNDDSRVADGVGSTGSWTMSGGIADIDSHWQVGAYGSGTYTQTGGTMNHNTSYPVIGRFAGGTGVANISGGNFNQIGANQRLIIGEEGTGTMTVSGTVPVPGTVRSDGGIVVGHLGGSNGTLNINTGGIVIAPWLGRGPGTGKINFNGGVFKASAASVEIFPIVDTVTAPYQPTGATASAADIVLQANGAKIDTNGLNVGTSVALGGVGSLTKQGNGTLTLNGITTYTGGTLVSAGTLALSATGGIGGAGAIDVGPGATLDASATGLNLLAGQTLKGKGTVLGTTNIGSGTLAPGNSIGTENFASLTLSGSSTSNFEIDPSAPQNADLANVTGSLIEGGTINITLIGGTLAKGQSFNLFDASSFSGNFTTVNLPALTGDLTWMNTLALNGNLAIVPEPSSLALGIISIGLLGRRRRR